MIYVTPSRSTFERDSTRGAIGLWLVGLSLVLLWEKLMVAIACFLQATTAVMSFEVVRNLAV